MGDLAIGSSVAGYRLDALLARGGMGVVYRATHLGLEREVALKVIAHELADREGFRERFLRESRIAAKLDHPAVVPIFDSREVEGELIVAMRLVEGGDLRRLIDSRGPLPPAEALGLLGQIAEALDAAHAAGIVHRDVKPHNILVEGDRAFLTDFGLAKALGESGAVSGASVVGTAEYMSPEQWRGGSVGPGADVYSLGCVLYEALTGIVPYARKAEDTEPMIPEGLEGVIERAVAKDPADRYPSAGALIAAARERQGSAPRPTRVLSGGGGEGRTRVMRRSPLGFIGRLSPRALQWTGAGVALLVAAAVLAVTLLGGDGVSVSSAIEVGRPPLRIAASDEAIWVTSERDGTLTRLDPESGEKVGDPLRVAPGIAGVAVGGGSVWVTDPPSGEVLEVSPLTLQVVRRIEVGGRPGPVVYGGHRIWVADEDGAGVTAINARGGKQVHARGLPPHSAPLRLAVGAGGIWVSSASAGTIRRIDLSSLQVDAPILVGRGPAGITVGHGLVWVANSRSATVTRVDPSIRAIIGDPISVGGRPGGIDSGPRLVWVANSIEGTVLRLDIEDGSEVGDPIEVGGLPGAVAVGATAVWVGDNADGTVTRIEP
jgi:streptogramin lyase/predicted Ser/Thr protein kinase